MSENQAALLTERQRQYLRDEIEPSNESRMKTRIRERVYEGLRRDGSILLDELDPEERREIFREWENQRNDGVRDDVAAERGVTPDLLGLHRGDFEIGLEKLLGLIYLGVEETNLDSFEELLEDGINEAVQERDQHVKELNLKIEFGGLMTLEEVFEMLKKGELEVNELTVSETVGIIKSDSFDLQELSSEQRTEIMDSLETFQSLRETLTSDEFWENVDQQKG